MELSDWIPAFIGIAGGLGTLVAAWWKDHANERRFLTKDALEAITLMHNLQSQELEDVKKSESECQRKLTRVEEKAREQDEEIFRLRTRIFNLEQKS